LKGEEYMVKLTRIYTRGGDKGKTSLGHGKRVLKTDARIEVIGAVDESNAAIGLIECSAQKDLMEIIKRIQNDLFDVGADLCVPEQDNTKGKLRITSDQVQFLEKTIDRYNARLNPLTSFVLPGGSRSSAGLHFARTVVRRAERRACLLHLENGINPEIIRYLNRLSDLLFVLARVMNDNGQNDVLWIPGGFKDSQ